MPMSKVTWNMQGGTNSMESKWVTFVDQLVQTYQIVFLQEAGQLPPSTQPEPLPPQGWRTPQPPGTWQYVKWPKGSSNRPRDVYILWLETDPNGGRVNLAIATKSKPDSLLYVDSGNADTRPSIGMEFNPESYYNIHGLANNNDKGRKVSQLITNISNRPQPWFALGDYNCEPDNWANAPAGAICPPDKPTHQSGKKLDYMIQFSPAGSVTGTVQPEGPIWSDHAFVVYNV